MPKIKDMLPIEAGRRLVEARCALGLTTKEMAEKLGLKSYQYGAYEREERAINGKVLAALRDTSINIDYIRTGEGELERPLLLPSSRLSGIPSPMRRRRWCLPSSPL